MLSLLPERFNRQSAVSVAVLLSMWNVSVSAQGLGVATLGATGGLTIPSAYVLGSGDMALSFGNYVDPKLGSFSKKENFSLGIGLAPHLEIFGRLANYQNPGLKAFSGADINGPRDISFNAKFQLPIDLRGIPKLAVGVTDVSGGAVFFKSTYAVASDEYGPVRWSLGYAKSRPALNQKNGARTLDGLFGGAELKLGATNATLLAENDGTQNHVGLRYYSEVLPWLGDSQIIGTVQRSFGAKTIAGKTSDATSLNLSLIIPLGTDEKTRRARAEVAAKPLPPLAALESFRSPPLAVGAPSPDASAAVDSLSGGAMVATPEDRLDVLARALRAMGLDRIRVGRLGTQLVVEYENYRYLQNEADALGVVLGLAAELAPAGTTRVHAITLKAGQSVFETSVDVAVFRLFLRDGDAASVKPTLGFGRLAGYDDEAVQWAGGDAGAGRRQTWLRVELKPVLNYTLATEFGLFDYSLAAQVRSTAALWKGAEAYVDVVQRIDQSDNVEPGKIFASSQIKNGVKTVALQQSFWVGPRWFNSIGVGRYDYDKYGAEGESIYFMPWNGDSAHLRGQRARSESSARPRVVNEAYNASYRYLFDSNTWVEAAYNRYTDTANGPSLTLTRWFGDVAVQLFARKGGKNTFAGLELSIPLVPRQGMGAGAVQFAGTPRYAQSIRTLLTTGANASNIVDTGAVRPVDLNFKPEVDMLNSGRITPLDIKDQVQRMRESFYLYAREHLN